MLEGLAARRNLLLVQSRAAMARLIAEQTRYIERIAERLGLTPEQLTGEYTLDLETREVQPKAAS